MSKELPQNNNSEEIDLGLLFNAIGKLFNRFINFIGGIFKGILTFIVFLLRAIIKNFKIIAIVMILAAGAGLALEKTQPEVYTSQMLVRPYFDSKYQLVTNVNYYNALIREKDFNQLKELFSIQLEEAKEIIEFEINPGPETENDRLIQYDEFMSSIDSIRAQEVDYDEFIENRSIYSGDVFEINVKSTQKDIFRSLEGGLNGTFTNTYSKKRMQKRDSLIAIDKQRILNSLKEVDSLKKVYINVLEEESKSEPGSRITVPTKDGLLIQERTNTREYELLDKQILLRKELSALEAQKVEQDEFFDTVSSFQDVGAKYTSIWEKYSIIFPILSFLLLCLIFMVRNTIKFVNNYEA